MGQLVAIVSQKGGVGKTATAVNLGACLSAIKRRVLLIGMDPQGGLERSFGLDSSKDRPGLFEVLSEQASPADVVYRCHERLPRLDLIPINVASVAEEARLVEILANNAGRLRRVAERIRPAYDFILVDCPSRLDTPTQAALAVADSYLVPVQCEYSSMATVGNVLRAALEVRKNANPKLGIFGFLLTMADKRARFTIKVIREVRQYLKTHAFRTIIPRDPRVAEVPNRQQPVVAFDMESPGSKAYISLAREILGRSAPGQEQWT